MFQFAPFVAFPAGDGPSSSNELGLGPTLELLGHTPVGDLYLNNDLAVVGLVCGGLSENVETTVKRLVASHLSDADAQVIIFHADSSTISRIACPFMKPGRQLQKILVSPRNLESTSRLYESVGTTAIPLSLEEGSVTTQQLLSLFTPPPDMRKRTSILNTVQLVIGQLREPFDLQHFIELVEKETWTEDGANFMALRQTILTGLLSSSQTIASFSSEPEVIVDFGDPILRSTGVDAILMDMVLQRVLCSTSRSRRLVVFHNAHEYLSAQSPLLRSIESLASRRLASIIITSTSPSYIPSKVFRLLDYMICGLARFALWEDTLRDQLTIHLPRSHWNSGQLIIWSPESKRAHTDGRNVTTAQGSAKWDDKLMVIDARELCNTMPKPTTHQPSPDSNDSVRLNFDFDTLALDTLPANSSLSSQLDEEGVENGMLPLGSAREGHLVSTGVIHGIEPVYDFGSTSSTNVERPCFSIWTSVKEMQEARETIPSALASPSIEQPTRVSSPDWTPVEQRVPLEDKYPDIFRPLVSGVLKLSSRQTGAWVEFEDLRKLVGDKKILQSLGWSTYTSYVKTSQEQKILELRYKAGTVKAVKLLPLTARERYLKSLTPAALALATCPARFRSIVGAILDAGGDDPHAKVPSTEVLSHFDQMPEDLETCLIHGASLPYWCQQAIDAGWIQMGKVKNKKTWFGLGEKLQSIITATTAP